MISGIIALVLGIFLLVWSADHFVEGASFTAHHFGMPSLLIGMVIVGFGTSMPELLISALASFHGKQGMALGNAYGSNIANIALILGLTALINPITVQLQVLRKELPILSIMTLLALLQIWDGDISRFDAFVLIALFGDLIFWSICQGLSKKSDPFGNGMEVKIKRRSISISQAIFRLTGGLVLLVISSRILVWGAVTIANLLGISDLIIGLTIVAVGTSLPELASSVIAARKGEHDIALGNILGSNLFNTLAVVGIAATIHPIMVPAEVLMRDMPVMSILTLSLFIIGFGFRGQGRINRLEGAILLCCYISYNIYLICNASDSFWK